MNRYTSGLFGKTRGPDQLEAFDTLFKREAEKRLMSRYGTPRRGAKISAEANAAVATAQSAPMMMPKVRIVLKERLLKSWDDPISTAVQPATNRAPDPEVAPLASPNSADQIEPKKNDAPPEPEQEAPLVEAGSFSVQDLGTLPDDDDLTDDVEYINEPRRPASEDTMRDAAIEDFMAMIDKSYRPPPAPNKGDVIVGQVFDADPIDVVADVAEMSNSAPQQELMPDITPISLPAVTGDMVTQEGISRGTDAVAALGLGLAVFQEFKAELTTGNVAVSATPARYIHANTQPDSRFIRVVTDFVFHAYHPRIVVSDQKFKIRIMTEIDQNDIRHAKINLVASESDDLIASSFRVNFAATALSLPKESMCKIRYDFSGKWDPKGTGEYDFNGMIDLWADGSVHIKQMISEFDSPTFSDKKIKAVRIVALKQVSTKVLPSKVRASRNHIVKFEKPKQSTLSDDQARAIRAFVEGIPKSDVTLIQEGRVPVIVEGFASTKGSVSDNQSLARDRRQTVLDFLRDHIGTDVVFTGKAHGELAAASPDDTEAAEHRKATIRIFTFKDK